MISFLSARTFAKLVKSNKKGAVKNNQQRQGIVQGALKDAGENQVLTTVNNGLQTNTLSNTTAPTQTVNADADSPNDYDNLSADDQKMSELDTNQPGNTADVDNNNNNASNDTQVVANTNNNTETAKKKRRRSKVSKVSKVSKFDSYSKCKYINEECQINGNLFKIDMKK